MIPTLSNGRAERLDTSQAQTAVTTPETEVSMPSISSQAQSLRPALKETQDRLNEIRSRERSSISGSEADKEHSGWFGKLHRAISSSDPYQIDIANSRRVLEILKHAERFLKESILTTDPDEQVALLNQARRLAGLKEVGNNGSSSSHTNGLNRVSTDTEHYQVEQKNISVSRDVLVTGVVGAGTLGSGLAVGALTKGGQVVATTTFQAVKQGVIAGATETFAESVVRNTEEVQNGKIAIKEAAGNVTADTFVGGATGGVLGGSLQKLGTWLAKFREGTEGVRTQLTPNPANSDDALKVDDDLLDRIQEAPPVTDRNRSPQSIPEPEEALVGVGAEAPSVAKAESADSISVKNEARVEHSSGGETTSNPTNDLGSSNTTPKSEATRAEPSPQARLEQKMIEQKFDTLIDLMDKFSNNNLDFRGQTTLIKEARELAEKGYPEILQGLNESGVIGELERSELISFYMDSKKINQLSQADYAILAATLIDENGNSLRPEITSELSQKKLDRLIRVFAKPDTDEAIYKAFRNTSIRDIIKIVEADGWMLTSQEGSHRQFIHRTKTGRVTVPGKLGDTLPEGTLKSVFTQAKLSKVEE